MYVLKTQSAKSNMQAVTLAMYAAAVNHTPPQPHLQCVLYPIGEVLHGAGTVALLRGVLGGGVGLGHFGKDHLHIALGALCSRLQERLAVVHTAAIHVLTW